MFRPLKFASRATLLAALMTLTAAATPGPAKAIQLRWGSGATDLSVTTNTRAILVVEADSTEGTLPPSWRLQWTADSSGVQFAAVDSAVACLTDTAKVRSVEAPMTPADSSAKEITAHFCSAGEPMASTAYFLVDIVGGSQGKLKAVALDPADSTSVIESNEVTFNGGIDGDYSPVVLSTVVSHDAIPLTVTATGVGLSGVRTARVLAPALGIVTLQIVEQSETRVTATGSVPQPLPASVLQLAASSSGAAEAPLAADSVLGVDATEAGTCIFNECFFTDPNPTVYPKDFAFVYGTAPNPWHGLFHLYYIRHFKNLGDVPENESVLAHTWSRDLRTWSTPDTLLEFPHGTVAWDKVHVWAPSIVYHDSLFYMFYTGVDSVGNQSIGYATTAVLDTSNTQWHRYHAPGFTTASAPSWAYNPASGQQCRDPFVMEDPDSTGRFLLLYSAQNAAGSHDLAVGLARNKPNTFGAWFDLGFYSSTSRAASGNGVNVESSQMFPDSAHATPGAAGSATWRLLFTHGFGGADSCIRMTTKTIGASVSDTSLSSWSSPSTWLWTYLNGDMTVNGQYATEHLKAGNVDFLATFDGQYGIGVSRMYWQGRDFFLRQPVTTAVPTPRPRPLEQPSVRVLGRTVGVSTLKFEIGLPAANHVRLTVYDVAGRRVRVVLDRSHEPGRTTIAWDGRDVSGAVLPSGVYFARLSGGFASRVARVPFVH